LDFFEGALISGFVFHALKVCSGWAVYWKIKIYLKGDQHEQKTVTLFSDSSDGCGADAYGLRLRQFV
jgi:hypothetical protein